MNELVAAMAARDEARLVKLLREGADPNALYEHDLTVLGVAVLANDESAVEQLLAAGADPNPALVLAAWESDSRVAILERLLAAGAEPDRPDQHGSTALYRAAANANAATVRVLLAAGADPNRRSGGPSDETPLYGAACWGHHESVQALLDAGADPNEPGSDGALPLLMAVEAMDQASVVSLLAAGADPNHPSDAIVLASEFGLLGIVQALLAHGADPSSKDTRGRTALEVARAKTPSTSNAS